MKDNYKKLSLLAMALAGLQDPYFKTSYKSLSRGYSGESLKDRRDKFLQRANVTSYVYPDGFECFARNTKNADRKHANFLKQLASPAI
jgi:hypothetical protein